MKKKKTGASLARGKSNQEVETPEEFIAAVEARFGPLSWDLAASKHNTKHPNFFSKKEDSFTKQWHKIRGNLWLNPEFDPIGPWVEKCAKEAALGAKILCLTPASVGSNWFRDFVFGKALVLSLNDRITFVGQKDPYPKDCILSAYGFGVGFALWQWKPQPPQKLVLR